ncbi:hypothetical protein JD969_12525 [Planctomycetota bacterium]|nr:hypothetical protein JD969_12525 [Planctomycetota bacterium]
MDGVRWWERSHSEGLCMLTMAMQQVERMIDGEMSGRVIEPVGQWVGDVDVSQVEIGVGGSDGGVLMWERGFAIDLWEVGVFYLVEVMMVVGVGVLLFGLMWLWLRRGWLREVKVGEVYCGKCGYGLTGMQDGGDVCPECGVKGVGDGGKRRKVKRGVVMSGRGLRWAIVVCGFLVLMMGGVLRVGMNRDWEWVDRVGVWMGAEERRVNKAMGWVYPSRSGIRRTGLDGWFKWKSRWAYRMMKKLGERGDFEGMKLAVVDWSELQWVRVEDGELVKEEVRGGSEVGLREVSSMRGVIDGHVSEILMRVGGDQGGDRGGGVWVVGYNEVGDEVVHFVDEKEEEMREVWKIQEESFLLLMLGGYEQGLSYLDELDLGDGLFLFYGSLRREQWRNVLMMVMDTKTGAMAVMSGVTDVKRKEGSVWESAKAVLLEYEGRNDVYDETFFEMLGEKWWEREAVTWRKVKKDEVWMRPMRMMSGDEFQAGDEVVLSDWKWLRVDPYWRGFVGGDGNGEGGDRMVGELGLDVGDVIRPGEIKAGVVYSLSAVRMWVDEVNGYVYVVGDVNVDGKKRWMIAAYRLEDWLNGGDEEEKVDGENE